MVSSPPPSLTLTPLTVDTLPPLSALLPPLTPLFPKTPQTPTPLPVDFLEILENWQIPNLNIGAILPSSLCPPPSSTSTTNNSSNILQTPTASSTSTFPWTDTLREAIITLSKLTVGQRERAHSLLCTYFSARIREASYKGNSSGTYATLKVCDVEKAIDSVRRMSRGRELEGDSTDGKRKFSIRDEEAAERAKERSRKMSRIMEIEEEEEGTDTRTGGRMRFGMPSPPSEAEKSLRDGLSISPTIQPLTPATTKRLIHLPPIQTTDIQTPTLPVIPLGNTTPQPSHHTSIPYNHPSHFQTSHLFPPHSTAARRPSFDETPLFTSPPIPHNPHPLFPSSTFANARAVEAAQRATHEFNVRRMELGNAERVYEACRVRFFEASRRMERARGRARG